MGSAVNWMEILGGVKQLEWLIFFTRLRRKFFGGAIPGSHRNEMLMTRWERRLWRLLLRQPTPRMTSRLSYLKSFDGRLWIRTKPSHLPTTPPTSPIWVRTAPNDCIIFDPRLIHAGGPVPHNKYAAFLSFGVQNNHAHRHLSKFSESQGIRTTEELREDLLLRLRNADLLLS